MKKIRPNLDRVLIEIDAAQEKVNNIFVPNSAQAKMFKNKGTVVEVGEGRFTSNGTFIKTKSKPGDRVAFEKPSRTWEFEEKGKTYALIAETDILFWED